MLIVVTQASGFIWSVLFSEYKPRQIEEPREKRTIPPPLIYLIIIHGSPISVFFVSIGAIFPSLGN